MSDAAMYGVVSPAALDYIQRAGIDPCNEIDVANYTSAPPVLRRLLHIDGISCFQKPRPPAVGESFAVPTENLLVGLSGYQIPLAFLIQGQPARTALHVATWSPTEREHADAKVLDDRRAVLEAILRGIYPSIEIAPTEVPPRDWPLGGIALGVPTVAPPDPLDGTNAIDRLASALTGMDWAVLVLAEPVDEQQLTRLHQRLINEMRLAAATEQPTGAPSPIARHYTELLKTVLDSLTRARSVGAWRTAVYLLGDENSYPCLASVWRAIFSGARSLPEPIRVFDCGEAVRLAAKWAMPDAEGAEGPGSYHHPYACQTLLTSSQLAGFIQLPRLELPGFSVRVAPAFDTTPPLMHTTGGGGKDAPRISVGKIVHRARTTSTEYSVSLKSLTRHTLIVGVTGAGKTNTIFHLLRQLISAGVPFLVIEPAKTEYRALIDDPAFADLRLFTLGEERVSPFRLNPFEVPTGVAVSQHLDLLRAAFASSFGMWTPLPQVLERCLHEIYSDRGWDLATNSNARLEGSIDLTQSFPTLSDLVVKVREVVPRLGYEERVTGDLRAALETRLNGLRTGGKGRMLDTSRSLPMDEILGHPTVLELEAMGDDDDKAFLMGLMLLRLAEHRRVAGQAEGLRHVLVIEEAHRLLAEVGGGRREEESNPRGKAVETFTNLLSEVRAYGQGMIIADQIPVRLASDVIKNTSLKITQRIVSADDRSALSAAMVMDENQTRALTVLSVGEAVVFSDGDDAPLLVRVPLSKDISGQGLPADGRISEHMASWRKAGGFDPVFLPSAFCVETCAGAPEACAVARKLAGDEYVQRTIARLVLSLIEDPDALDRMWGDLVETVRARHDSRINETQLLQSLSGHGAAWFAGRRGTQAAWSYSVTQEFAALLRRALSAKVTDAPGRDANKVREEFRAYARGLHARSFPPYPACERICEQDPPVCIYRHAVADLVASTRFQQFWLDADTADLKVGDGSRRETWRVCESASYELIEYPEEDWLDEQRRNVGASARRLGLCFAQQMLVDDKRKVPRSARVIIDSVITESTDSERVKETASKVSQ